MPWALQSRCCFTPTREKAGSGALFSCATAPVWIHKPFITRFNPSLLPAQQLKAQARELTASPASAQAASPSRSVFIPGPWSGSVL